MRAIAKRLPLTAPPAVPTQQDVFDLAGINDRFHRLFRSLGRPVAVSKAPSGEEQWDVRANTFAVTAGFFALNARRQLDMVIAKMIESAPDVAPDHQAAFVVLTDDLRRLDGVDGP
jgi:hypothetical protein